MKGAADEGTSFGLAYDTDVPPADSAAQADDKKKSLLSRAPSLTNRLEVIALGAGTDCAAVPGVEELERLILAAVFDAHPQRFEAIRAFLQAAPERTDAWGVDAKPGAYTYAAAYETKVFSDAFADALWRDDKIGKALKARMCATGAWQSLERLCLDGL